MFSFHHLKRMAAINQLNNFLNKKQLLQYRVCMAIKYYCFYSLWQNKKPQKQRNMFKVKGQCIWDIYFLYLSNCDSNPEFPFSLHKKPAWWSHSLTKHAGFCCTKLGRLQMSSVTDLQKLALNFNLINFQFTLCESKHHKKPGTFRLLLIRSCTLFDEMRRCQWADDNMYDDIF